MRFSPQRYKIPDSVGQPFINEGEISDFLTVRPSAAQVVEVVAWAQAKNRLSLDQVAVLLHAPDRSVVFGAAERLKKEVYGNRIVLFAPLYVGNRCANSCAYCSFRVENSGAVRKTLSDLELVNETEALTAQGHKRLILVYGEHPDYSAEFIAHSVRTVYQNKNIRRLNINAAPFSVADFSMIKQANIGTFQVFQETYLRDAYASHHPRGRKADYDWRLTALDRAMEAGIDDVGIGVLFGLSRDWRAEVMGLVRHVNHLEACFNVGPHTISFPRITAAPGSSVEGQYPLSDDDFLYLIAVLRLAVPYAGLILTAREPAALRDRAIGFGVSQIDGGTKLEVGGYEAQKEDRGAAQFSLSDDRSLAEVIERLVAAGRIPSFCTACYRQGRTGEHFMEFSTNGFIKRFCGPNAVLTFAEYLEDYAGAELKEAGNSLIDKELTAMPADVADKLARIRNGERDLFY